MVITVHSIVNRGWFLISGGHQTGFIPAELGNLTSLTSLSLNVNNLSGQLNGTIPAEWGNLTSLLELSVAFNPAGDQIATGNGLPTGSAAVRNPDSGELLARLAEHVGPAYLRFGRPVVPVFTDADQKFANVVA